MNCKKMKHEAMARKLEILRHAKDRYLKADKFQYAPDCPVEIDFVKHLYFILGADTSDIMKVRQNAAGVLNTPEIEAEQNISQLLNNARFTAMELSCLEAYALLNDRASLLQNINRMMRACMAGSVMVEVQL